MKKVDMLGVEIRDFASKFKKEYARVLKKIIHSDRIAIFRHIMPDYDALGTQLGLAQWIKDNFPNKEVICLGDNHVNFTPRIFPEMDRVNNEWFDEPFLALVVDTSNKSRIADPRAFKTRNMVRIDHHPSETSYARTNIVAPETAAAAEIVIDMLVSFKGEYKLTKEAARFLYIALVGDSGRFLYNSTTPLTFSVAKQLLYTGINISDIYNEMYQKDLKDLNVTAWLLNNFTVSPKGVAYYILNDEKLKELGMSVEEGKTNVNMFSNIRGINIWCSITEDPQDKCWRVSIRTSRYIINEIATKWGGGGHAQASGAKLNTLDDLPEFIADLEAII